MAKVFLPPGLVSLTPPGLPGMAAPPSSVVLGATPVIDPASAAQRLAAIQGGNSTAIRRAYLDRLTEEEVVRRFDEARRLAAEQGVSLKPAPSLITRETSAGELLKRYLIPYRSYFRPHRASLVLLAYPLRVPPDTFYGWLYLNRDIPIEKFAGLVDFLEISDPAWPFYLFYKRDLDRYFDPKVVDGKILLVTKKGGAERPIDYGALKRFGLGGLIYEARIRAQMDLSEVSEAISRLPRNGQRLVSQYTAIGRYERNIEVPNKPRNAFYLDLLIRALRLNPSAAYIASGRPWLPGLIPVYDRLDWEKGGISATPIGSQEAIPDPREPVTYEAPRTSEKGARKVTSGFGAFLRQVRRLSNLEMAEAGERLGRSGTAIKTAEIDGTRVPFETLQQLAVVHCGAAVRRLSQYSEDPLEELVIRHNREFYPRVPAKLLKVEGGTLYLSSDRDARLVRRLFKLPECDFRRRLLTFRLRRGWSLERAARELKEGVGFLKDLEDPIKESPPPFRIVKVLADAEDPKGSTLDDWRRSVRETFYPQVPWEVLQRHRIYLASLRDVRQILRLIERGEVGTARLGPVLFRIRTGLKRNQVLNEFVQACGVTHQDLADAELSRSRPSDQTLDRIARVSGFDLEELRRLRDQLQPNGNGPLRLNPPTMREIHTAGLGLGGEEVLPQFPAFQALARGDRIWLVSLWEAQNRLVACYGTNGGGWASHAEYLDPAHPHALALAVIQTSDLRKISSVKKKRSLLELHSGIRAFLAGEGVWVPGLPPDYLEQIRYRVTATDLPVRDGTVVVALGSIDRTLAHFEATIGPLKAEERDRVREDLIRLEIVKRDRRAKGRANLVDGKTLVGALFRRGESLFAARLKILTRLIEMEEKGESGDRFFEALPDNPRLWDLFLVTGEASGIPSVALLRVVKETEKQFRITKVGFNQLPTLLRLMSLLKVRRPWEILYRIFRKELDWAFHPAQPETGELLFRVPADCDLSRLRSSGFGPVLNVARSNRRWSFEEMARRVTVQERSTAQGEEEVAPLSMAALGANRRRPDFSTLQAIVAAFNADPDATSVDPGVAFLASFPTFVGLLPLYREGSTEPLSLPTEGPFEMVPYPDRREGGSPRVTFRAGDSRRLDPKGFASLIRNRRLFLHMSNVEAARRLGVQFGYLNRLEQGIGRQSPSGVKEGLREVPGRLLVSLLIDPKGYDLPAEQVMAAIHYTYWRDDPVVSLLTGRTFQGPVFIDDRSHKQLLQAYASHPFQTPGEILYWWRNSPKRAALVSGHCQFPIPASEMAAMLGVTVDLYLDWESNRVVPQKRDVRRMVDLFSSFPAEAAGLVHARRRMRGHRDLSKLSDGAT